MLETGICRGLMLIREDFFVLGGVASFMALLLNYYHALCPCLNAPGVLHLVRARGIMRQTIFRDDSDRDDFVVRLGALANAGAFHVYTWAL